MRAERVLVAISLALALAAAALVTGPLGFGHDNFLYIFLPAIVTLIPLAMDRAAALIVAAGLLLMFVFLEILTIGVYYLPAAGAMSTAALIAWPASMKGRRREVGEIAERARSWASERPEIRAVAMVGSWSRETARRDSDLDLVVLTTDVDKYVETSDWISALGDLVPIGTRGWGRVTERRLRSRSGLEIDMGFATPDWPGIADVRPLYDPDGLLEVDPAEQIGERHPLA